MSNKWVYGDHNTMTNISLPPESPELVTASSPSFTSNNSSNYSDFMADYRANDNDNDNHNLQDDVCEHNFVYRTSNNNNNKVFKNKKFDHTTSVYDTMEEPFKHDSNRGYWAMTCDFYFACISHMFGSTLFMEENFYTLYLTGIYFLPIYFMAVTIFAIPTFLIQTFLGQFSSSGLISAFRVVPIFKGLGYSMLTANLISLTYSSVKVAMPLIYAANSLHTNIPWMHCHNPWNTPNCSTHTDYNVTSDETIDEHSVIEFFRYILRTDNMNNSNWNISWPIFFAVLSIWLLVFVILLKCTSFIGKFFRCTSIVLICFFGTIFVYTFINLGITYDDLVNYFKPALDYSVISKAMSGVFLMSTASLGPGVGNVITLASYNHFRRDSEKLTYWVHGTNVLLAVIVSINGLMAWNHFEDHVGLFHYHVEENHSFQYIYLCYAFLFGSFNRLPNLWSFLFFSMLFLAELCAVIIQMMAVLTTIFDEFSKLRKRKTIITTLLVLIMMLCSVYFCTKIGLVFLTKLPEVVILTNVIIWILLLVVTTWIYGRDRFQCDLQFMLGKTISSFKILVIRFITPIILIVSILTIAVRLEKNATDVILILISQTIVYVCTPIYIIYKVCSTTASWQDRKRQCFKPHDWHPVNTENRRYYEEIMGISEMLVIDHEQ